MAIIKRMRKILIANFMLGALVVSGVAFAQEPTPPAPGGRRGAMQEFKQNRRVEVKDRRGDVRDIQTGARDAIMKNRVETRLDVSEKRRAMRENPTPENRQQFLEEAKMMRGKMQEENKMTREKRMTDVKKRREDAKTKLEEYRKTLKEKLGKIKDERKKGAVERIDKNLDALNAKVTARMTATLKVLEDNMTKIDSRTDKAEASGKDVTLVRFALTTADGLIKKAHDAVDAQAAKTYPITITTEDKLGPAVSATRKTLNDDLHKVRTAIEEARKALHDAVFALKGIPGVNTEPTLSPPPPAEATPPPPPTGGQ